MDFKEKVLLLQLILEDIRGDWGSNLDDRVSEAYLIAEHLGFDEIIESIHEFRDDIADGYVDGRHFRCHYTDGGYEGLEEIHGLERLMKNRSDEFIAELYILNYPEYCIDDWAN